MRRAEKIITWILPIISLGVFICYSTLSKRADAIAILSAAVGIFIFTALGIRGIRSTLGFFILPMYNRRDELIGERTRFHMHPRWRIFFRTILMQIIVIFIVYLIFTAVNGYSGTIFNRYSTIFMHQNAYGIGLFAHNAGSELALLPILSKLITYINITETISDGVFNLIAFIINSIIVSAGCVMLYEVMLLDYDRSTSLKSLNILFVSPLILFMLMPLSGTSLVFLLSLLFFYFMKTSRPLVGLFFMVEAILMNVLASILIIPFVLLCVKLIIKGAKAKKNIVMPIMALSTGVIALAGIIGLIYYKVIGSHAISLIYPYGFRWYFEGLTAPIIRWNSSNSSALAMFFAISAQIAAALVAMRCIQNIDFSIAIFMISWLALTPMAFADPSMAVYAVCSCPVIPNMLSICARRRITRLILWLILAIVFFVFTSTVFAYRLA